MRALILIALGLVLGVLLAPALRRVWRYVAALWDIHVNKERAQ